jgi:hypothetical protein
MTHSYYTAGNPRGKEWLWKRYPFIYDTTPKVKEDNYIVRFDFDKNVDCIYWRPYIPEDKKYGQIGTAAYRIFYWDLRLKWLK